MLQREVFREILCEMLGTDIECQKEKIRAQESKEREKYKKAVEQYEELLRIKKQEQEGIQVEPQITPVCNQRVLDLIPEKLSQIPKETMAYICSHNYPPWNEIPDKLVETVSTQDRMRYRRLRVKRLGLKALYTVVKERYKQRRKIAGLEHLINEYSCKKRLFERKYNNFQFLSDDAVTLKAQNIVYTPLENIATTHVADICKLPHEIQKVFLNLLKKISDKTKVYYSEHIDLINKKEYTLEYSFYLENKKISFIMQYFEE